MKLGKGINLTEVAVHGLRVVVEAGTYNVRCTSAEMKETKKGGHMLLPKFSIIGGEHAGVELSDMLNVVNANEDAQRIGLSKVKAILTYGGHSNPNMIKDTDELIGLKLAVSVSVADEQFKGDKGEMIDIKKNYVEGYMALRDEEPKKVEEKVVEEKKEEVTSSPKKETAKNPWE